MPNNPMPNYHYTTEELTDMNVAGFAAAYTMLHAHKAIGVQLSFGLNDFYEAKTKTVNLTPLTWIGSSLKDICIATHEAGHAIQHKRWPLLFALHQLLLLKWPLRLFLEAHASYTAYRWMKQNLTLATDQTRAARKLFFRSWLTYLLPPIFSTTPNA